MPETTQFGGNFDNGGNNQIDGVLQPNTILLARYKIDGQLGGGGQGAVYRARDLNFPEAKRLVAIKEMLVTSSDPNHQANAMKTFQREANILATLNHPAIPKIYDFFSQNDRAYLVMEYINGRDLEAILTRTKKLPMKKIVEWSIDLCDVLQYLHTHQPEPIMFRDMKPANIMIDSLGKVRLIDFGIAKIFVSGLPQTMIGTEGYSAPEQYKGKANPLSDIYSLGATLHHVITRMDPRLELPFSFAERPITQLNSEATPQLAAVIDKALQFEPENRWQSCVEMKDAFEALRYPVTTTAVAPANANNNGEQSTEFFTAADAESGGLQPVWTFTTEDEIRSSPVVYRDMIFVGSYDTNIWAVSFEKGELRWKRATEGGIASSPVVDAEHKQVLFGSEDGTYRAVSHLDGNLNWTYTTGDKIRGTGTLAHGYIFFGSDDGNLYALIAHNGRFMWDYDAGAPVRSRPVVTNDRIIFGTEAGDLVGLELSGQKKWSVSTRRSIVSAPYVDSEGVCYVGAFDNFIHAVDANSGLRLWRMRTNGPIISSPTMEDDYVYIGSTDGKLYCINAQTGKDRWTFDTEKPIVSSPIIYNNVVYFGGTDNKLYAVNAKSGKELWSFEAGGAITSTPCIANDLIIFGSLDRKLYALPLLT